MFYGVISLEHLKAATKAVCDCIGHGRNNKAVAMLLETCAAETHCGNYRDPTPNGAGRGVTQIDHGTFDWLKDKYQNSAIAAKLDERFGIDIRRVQHSELDYNPLLALIFARLRYWTVTECIPATRKLRADYWKKYYNTELGKGTAQHYLAMALRHLGERDA